MKIIAKITPSPIQSKKNTEKKQKRPSRVRTRANIAYTTRAYFLNIRVLCYIHARKNNKIRKILTDFLRCEKF